MHPMIHRPFTKALVADPEEGFFVADDFAALYAGLTKTGLLNWTQGTVAGGAGSWNNPAPTAESEIGILSIWSGGATGDKTAIHAGHTLGLLGFPVGMTLSIKFKAETTTNQSFLAGWKADRTASWLVGDADSQVGIRHDTAVDANVHVVFKDGAGGGNEDTLSLGAADTDWHIVKIVRRSTAEAAVYLDGALVGTITLTNVPTVAMLPIFCVGTTENVVKKLGLDWWASWGQVARS